MNIEEKISNYKKYHTKKMYQFGKYNIPYVYSKRSNNLIVEVCFLLPPVEIVFEDVLFYEKQSSFLLIDFPQKIKNIDEFIKGIKSLINHLGYEKAIFVSYGYGCNILEIFRLEYSNVVTNMIFVNPAMLVKMSNKAFKANLSIKITGLLPSVKIKQIIKQVYKKKICSKEYLENKYYIIDHADDIHYPKRIRTFYRLFSQIKHYDIQKDQIINDKNILILTDENIDKHIKEDKKNNKDTERDKLRNEEIKKYLNKLKLSKIKYELKESNENYSIPIKKPIITLKRVLITLLIIYVFSIVCFFTPPVIECVKDIFIENTLDTSFLKLKDNEHFVLAVRDDGTAIKNKDEKEIITYLGDIISDNKDETKIKTIRVIVEVDKKHITKSKIIGYIKDGKLVGKDY